MVCFRQILDEVMGESELCGFLYALHLVLLRCCFPFGADEAVGDVFEHAAVEQYRLLGLLVKVSHVICVVSALPVELDGRWSGAT